MDPRSAFIATVEDLRSRSGLTASEYDLTQAAGLIRRLVIDGRRLMDQANRTARLAIECEWHKMFRLRPGKFWIWDLLADPAMYSPYLASEGVSDEALLSQRPTRAKVAKFLKEPIIVRHNDGAALPVGEQLTVQELISEFANRRGGVHIDQSKAVPPLLALALEDPAAVHLALGVVGRVITRALEPLVAVAHVERLQDAEAAMMRLSVGYGDSNPNTAS